jgi:hypothetical protein
MNIRHVYLVGLTLRKKGYEKEGTAGNTNQLLHGGSLQ